jgi:hypothetical protein
VCNTHWLKTDESKTVQYVNSVGFERHPGLDLRALLCFPSLANPLCGRIHHTPSAWASPPKTTPRRPRSQQRQREPAKKQKKTKSGTTPYPDESHKTANGTLIRPPSNNHVRVHSPPVNAPAVPAAVANNAYPKDSAPFGLKPTALSSKRLSLHVLPQLRHKQGMARCFRKMLLSISLPIHVYV